MEESEPRFLHVEPDLLLDATGRQAHSPNMAAAGVGTMLAGRVSNALLGRIFLVAVICLAIKTLVWVLPW